MTLFASANGRRVVKADVRFTREWTADLDFDEAGAPLTGAVTIVLGGLTLKGTVDAAHAGTFAEGRRVRVLGGAGGWGKELPPRPYHNDAGVRRSLVLQDAAREAGETLELDAASDGRIGSDYDRPAGAASAVFAHAAPGLVWWVDVAGVTHVAAARPTAELAPGADLELLDFDPRTRTATLAGDPAAIAVGTVLRYPGRLEEPVVVRELVLSLDGESLRIFARDGADLVDTIKAIARAVRDEVLLGAYRYRVVGTSVDRVKLQAVQKGRWPDVLPASLACGIAGGWADLTPGAIVLVMFEDGSPTAPFVAHYTPKGRPGHVPAIAALDGTQVHLGAHEAAVHRVGDLENGGTFTAAAGPVTYTGEDGKTWQLVGTVAGTPVLFTTIPITADVAGKLVGKAAVGSAKVKA